LLPANRIQIRIIGNEAVPVWIGTEDHVWIRALIADFVRLDGHSYREVASFLREPPRVFSPAGKRQMAIWTILNLCEKQRPPVNAFKLRAAIAEEAQRARDAGRFVRSDVIETSAQRLGLSSAEVEEQLFSDLPGERRIILPQVVPDPHSLAMRTNLALAQGLLRLASEVDIDLYGGARAVVRQIHLKRLLCTVRRVAPEKVRLHISGAFSLFHHTTMYGRALASILPLLAWCERFVLLARCMLRGRIAVARLCSGDPIAIGEPPRAFDSRLEERFARDFSKANLDWDLVREPEPVEAGDALIFPDFAVVHRRDASKRFLLEIVGFWTQDYLREKLRRLHSVASAPLVLCIDRGLNCSAGELPVNARIVWFEKRIDPCAVLSAIDSLGFAQK
jgi:predicted nuclease of restriction endonuclease-like RecB superfamily